MSSTFFRRPGDDSDESSSEDAEDVESINTHIDDEAKEETGLESTETVSSNASLLTTQNDDGTEIVDTETHRNLMLATLLEDFYTTRAVEFINNTRPGVQCNRDSPEVKTLTQKLLVEAGQALSSTGILSSEATSNALQSSRKQYLNGLNSLSLRQMRENDLLPTDIHRQLTDAESKLAVTPIYKNISSFPNMLPDSVRGFIHRTEKLSLLDPQSDLRILYPLQRPSHYDSSFKQLRLLGKGGFGRVYHACNVFDQKDYAIKKIPLSSKLSRSYQEGGDQELKSVLREMQTLAQLEHHNIVRYHATWIEEPRVIPSSINMFSSGMSTHNQKLLQDNSAYSEIQEINKELVNSKKHSDGIIFELSSTSEGVAHHPATRINTVSKSIDQNSIDMSESLNESEIFTDGQGHLQPELNNPNIMPIDQSVHVLHVQMSMYPMTLAEYLSPLPTMNIDSSEIRTQRHCFHIIPALRILLGILCGLQYIHAKGLVHRDIKPSNIFVSTISIAKPNLNLLAEGYQDIGDCLGCLENLERDNYQIGFQNTNHHYINPRIGDFGLVTHLTKSSNSMTNSNSKQVGTEFYRPPPPSITTKQPSNIKSNEAPEIQMIPAMDEKLDVFALGVILVELLWRCTTSSERIYVLRDLQHGQLPSGLLTSLETQVIPGSGITRRIMELINGMICPDPGRRFSTETVKTWSEKILDDLQQYTMK